MKRHRNKFTILWRGKQQQIRIVAAGPVAVLSIATAFVLYLIIRHVL